MIEKLTKEQERQMIVYRDKLIADGIDTRVFTEKEKKKCEDSICYWYKKIGKNKPKVVYVTSPVVAVLAANVIKNIKGSSAVDSAVYSAVHSAVGSAVSSAVDSAVGSAVRSAVDSAVRSAVRSAVSSAVDSAVGSAVRSAVDSAVSSAVRSAVSSAVDSAVYSAVHSAVDSAKLENFESWWAKYNSGYWAWVTYYRDVLGVKIPKAFDMYHDSRYSAMIYMFEKFVFCVENHVEIHHNGKHLHNPNGMSLKYSDGWGIYSLNGVLVSKEIVETRAEDLDAKIILQEKNAEVRREIIRKIGVEKAMKDLGAVVLDSKWGYELLSLNIGDRVRPYLKMRNPSIGTYHIEGVHPDIRTVTQALNWRNGDKLDSEYTIPDILT